MRGIRSRVAKYSCSLIPPCSVGIRALVEEEVECYCYCGKKPQNEDKSGGDVGCYGDGDGAWLQRTHC